MSPRAPVVGRGRIRKPLFDEALDRSCDFSPDGFDLLQRPPGA